MRCLVHGGSGVVVRSSETSFVVVVELFSSLFFCLGGVFLGRAVLARLSMFGYRR